MWGGTNVPQRKKVVKGEVFNEKGEKVFEGGTFHCYVLEKHVLEKG